MDLTCVWSSGGYTPHHTGVFRVYLKVTLTMPIDLPTFSLCGPAIWPKIWKSLVHSIKFRSEVWVLFKIEFQSDYQSKGTHRNTCTPKMKTWFNRTLLRQSAKLHAGLIAHSLDASFCLLSQIIGAKAPLSPGLRAVSTLCTRNLVNHPKQFVIQTNYRKIET